MSQRHTKSAAREPIAIVGIGCRFPGGADSPEAFWELLASGTDAIRPMPVERFPKEQYDDTTLQAPGQIVTRQGGFLDQIDRFDAQFFGVSPREASAMDPQQRLLLETASEALADAGIPKEQLAGSQTGVYVGVWTSDYEQSMFAANSDIDLYMTTGGGRYAAAGRLSYVFDLQGPSMTVDTACSSSLVAIHLACQALWSNEITFALAGAANLILQPSISIGYSRSRMLSPDGRCKFGDARANGYVRSEGCAVVALKPLSQALADNDQIYALIRGTAINNDGHSSGSLVAPSGQGQLAMLQEAYRQAGILPGAVDYVEAHGTGTPVGDPVELRALGAVLGEGREQERPCIVGSVKTNIGHTEAASGMAGLIKAALSLKYKQIPASLHFETPNPAIPWDELPLVVQRNAGPWPIHEGPRYAGVNSFGVTGTNAHVVLESAPEPVSQAPAQVGELLLPVSANSPEALTTLAQSYRALLADEQVSLADLAYSISARLSHYHHRLAIVAHSHTDAIAAIDAYTSHTAHPRVVAGEMAEHPPRIAFVFPGQGSQWPGMARQLLRDEPVFRAAIEECERAIRAFSDWSLIDQLTRDDSQLDQIDVIQPALFAIQVALAALWRSWGVAPAAVAGHSMGEVAAAHVAGILSLEDAARVICVRSKLLRRIRGQGAMAVVNLPQSEAQELIGDHQERVAVAVSNSPRSTVLSGDPATLEQLLEQLKARNIFCRMVKVDVASHSPQVDELLDELFAALDGIQPQAGTLPFYSTVSGKVLAGAEAAATLGPRYWLNNLRQPVQFSRAVAQLAGDGFNSFIELSPHPILLGAVEETLQHHGLQGQALASMQRDTDERLSMLRSLGSLYTHGLLPNWQAFTPGGRMLAELPSYPWQRKRYWWTDTAPRRERVVQAVQGDSLLGERLPPMALMPGVQLWNQTHTVEDIPPALRQPLARAEILSGALYAALGIQAAAQSLNTPRLQLRRLAVQNDVILNQGSSYTIQTALTPQQGTSELRVYGRSGAEQRWVEHAQGQLSVMNDELPAIVLEAIQARIATAAIELPGLADIQLGSREALARLSLADDESGQANARALGASLRLLAALHTQGELVLSAIDTLSYERERKPAWAYARLTEQQGAGLVGDIAVLDDQAQVVFQATGVQLAAAQAGLLERIEQARAGQWLYQVTWHACPPAQEINTPPARWLVFADRGGLGAELARLAVARGGEAIVMYAGEGFGRGTDGSYTLNPSSSADLRRVLAEIGSPKNGSYDAAIYLWALDHQASEGLNGSQLLAHQRQITGYALAVAKQLVSESGQHLRLWLASRAAMQLEHEPVNSEQTPLWGLGRVIASEYPELWGGLVDLAPEPTAPEASELLAAVLAGDQENQVALRAGKRYAARLVRSEAPVGVPSVLRADATYLITGGAGGVGLALAHWMLKNGARHIALLGRRPLDQAIRATLHTLEAQGAEVAYFQADAARHEQLGAALAQIERQMPPLRGIIHAAGLLADAALPGQDWPRFEQVMESKLAGAWNLHTQTAGLELDFFVLCSSINALIGMPGQANYAAANAFLDGLAQQRRAAGQTAQSINWGPWADVGLVAKFEQTMQLDRHGLGLMAPTTAAALFGRLLNQPEAQVVVADVAWETMFSQFPHKAQQGLLREQAQSAPVTASAAPEAQNDLLVILEQAPFIERYTMLLEYIQTCVATVLHFERATQVPPGQGFFQIGMDSLTALELKNSISRGLGKQLPATLAFDYPTAATMARYLLTTLFPAEPPPATVSPEPQNELEELEELSRDDLKALLDAELDAIDI